jgi:phage terminase Nu1 subunit (DNA packaging protein)
VILPGNAITITAYAKRRGVARYAVQQRIEAGSLPTAAKRVKKRWIIVDPDLADAEWERNTRPYVSSESSKTNGSASPLSEATLRERIARAEAMELENARKRRDLVPRLEVDLSWSARVVAARTRMLGLPSRAKQRIPHLTGQDIAILESLIREALEELADDRLVANPA